MRVSLFPLAVSVSKNIAITLKLNVLQKYLSSKFYLAKLTKKKFKKNYFTP
jgi:hypothetical protein